MSRAVLPTLACALLLGACSDEPGTNLPFDGNVIVGDGALDSGVLPPTDLGVDLGVDLGTDGGFVDTGTASDAGPSDLGPADAGDAGPTDAGDAGVSCETAATMTLTSTQARDNAAALDGTVVEVTGVLQRGALLCTRIACSPENPCCNTCSASLSIDRIVEIVANRCFTGAGCFGDECNQVCSPPVGLPGTFRGLLQHNPGASPSTSLAIFSAD